MKECKEATGFSDFGTRLLWGREALPGRLAGVLPSATQIPCPTCLHTVKPHVVAYKKSEHGNEGDTGVLVCKCNSYPSVTEWTWYKKENDHYMVSLLPGACLPEEAGGQFIPPLQQ